jgi:hypothetical protein
MLENKYMNIQEISTIDFYSFDALGPRCYGFTVTLKNGKVIEIDDSGWKEFRRFIAENGLDTRNALEEAVSNPMPDELILVYP